MTLFLRRGRPRLGAGFRPALIRHGQKRPSAVAEPKVAVDLDSMSKKELKDFLTLNNVSYIAGLTKAELLVLAQAV